MDIQLAEQRIFLLDERIPVEQIQQRAMDRRMNAIASGLGSLLQRPKPEDVVLLGSERRLDPFWHVSGRALYVYERAREYTVPVAPPEVRSVTINGLQAEVRAAGRVRQFSMTVTEHCVEELANALFISGTTGEPVVDGPAIVNGPRQEVADPTTLSLDGAMVIAPEHRASFVVRTLLTGMMKPVQADSAQDERMVLETTDLYYRPVHAFEFFWKPRDRRGVVEVDAVTGQVTLGRSLSTGFAKLLTRDNIFDIGADTAGLLIPGGSIAVRVAKIAIDQATRPSN